MSALDLFSTLKENGSMSEHCTSLTQAARILGSHLAALRKTLNQFGIIEREGRQRVIPNDILALFRRTKLASGYLYPRSVRTHDDLIAAAKEIPAEEVSELCETACTNGAVP